ncbi:Short palate, lung and nasal epithelium carcinoma-associated protein 2, partial [Heterocephalus glaber]
MFQLWKLLLLCYLLHGTSAGLLLNFGHGLSNLVDQVKPIIHNGLETVDNVSEGFLNLNSRVLQNISAKKKIPRIENVVELALPYVHPSLENPFGVKITKTVIRDIQAEWAADGRSINLRFLATANVTVALPLVCKRVNLEVSLDPLAGIRLVPVPQTNLFTVVVGEFTVDPASITVSLLDRADDMINKAMDSTIGVLKMIVSTLLQKQVSP